MLWPWTRGLLRHWLVLTVYASRPGTLPLVQFSRSVVSDSLRPHGLQHIRPPCPSPTPGVYSNSCPLSWWCHPTISSSVWDLAWAFIFPELRRGVSSCTRRLNSRVDQNLNPGIGGTQVPWSQWASVSLSVNGSNIPTNVINLCLWRCFEVF